MNLNLGFGSLVGDKSKSSSTMLATIVDMHNAQYAVDIASKKVVAVISHDREVREAVAILKQTKHVVKTYGASESIMAIFNTDDQLANAIGIAIPEITSVNVSAVGIACCEAIDEKVVSATNLVRTFFNDLVASAAIFFEKLDEVVASQKQALDALTNGILNEIEAIDAEAFAKEEVVGYAQVVFMSRVKALAELSNKLSDTLPNDDNIDEFKNLLKILGYEIRENNVIEEETPAEAASDAPPAEEIMHAPPAPATEDLDADESNTEVVPENEPADKAQEQTMAVFGWNPTTIKEAVNATSVMLDSANNLRSINDQLLKLQNCANQVIDEINISPDTLPEVIPEATDVVLEESGSTEGLDENSSPMEKLESYRECAAFFGEIITIYQSNTAELVNQLVVLCGKLTKVELAIDAPEATPVEEITTENPTGENITNELEEPEHVPETEPIEYGTEIDEETEPQPGDDIEHIVETETPEQDQPNTDLPGEESSEQIWHY